MTALALSGAASVGAAGTIDRQSIVEPPPALDNPTHSDIVFERVALWSYRGSRLAAQGTGDRLVYEREGGHGRVTGPVATVFPAQPTGVIDHVAADSATGALSSKIADAQGHVTLTRIDGSAATESAHFDGDAHRLSGKQPVDVVTRRFRVHGTAFEADTTTEVADFEGPVTGDGTVRR